MGDFEAAPQGNLSAGKGLEASREAKFRSNLGTWRFIAELLGAVSVYRIMA